MKEYSELHLETLPFRKIEIGYKSMTYN